MHSFIVIALNLISDCVRWLLPVGWKLSVPYCSIRGARGQFTPPEAILVNTVFVRHTSHAFKNKTAIQTITLSQYSATIQRLKLYTCMDTICVYMYTNNFVMDIVRWGFPKPDLHHSRQCWYSYKHLPVGSSWGSHGLFPRITKDRLATIVSAPDKLTL